VGLDPANRDYRYNQAVTLNFMGRVAEAEAALEALIAPAPGEARAHHLLASLRKQTVQANHVARLETAFQQAAPQQARPRAIACCWAMRWPRNWRIWARSPRLCHLAGRERRPSAKARL
jgi:predicted Zn-dependent protease